VFLLGTVVGLLGVAEGDVGLGRGFGQTDELYWGFLGFAEHFWPVFGLEQRDDVLGRLAGFELRPVCEVENVALVFIVSGELFEEAGALEFLLAGLLRPGRERIVHLTNIILTYYIAYQHQPAVSHQPPSNSLPIG